MILVVRIVQHGVEVQLVDLRDRADVAGYRARNLRVLLALKLIEMRDLERLARIADEELRAGAYRALVHAEHAEPADERIDADLEHVRDHVALGIGRHLHALRHDCRAALRSSHHPASVRAALELALSTCDQATTVLAALRAVAETRVAALAGAEDAPRTAGDDDLDEEREAA